ncbi:alpha/beta fold hydrolase [Catellatospora sp. IY07-71]|uniref:alpha/beta fold hydrolase n=1 Tax=Catellatospora sp. IY07-71 TaxID=2728827 RepID=UPI001BB44F64|nr:alpha/beta hydrolase [Catellatospora sp. IY07-71]
MVLAEPERVGQVGLADGRRLGWAEWGPAGGVPVLFCPGAGTSRRLGFGADVADALGVRLISLDRPGLGASDPAPGRTLTDWAADVAGFAAASGAARPAVVGFSQGAPFALACAAAGVVSAAALVSGTDELARPEVAARLEPQLRWLVSSADDDPDEAEAYFAQLDAGRLRHLVTSMSGDADRAVYEDPAFAAAFRRALAEGFAQGPAGYARDALLAMRPWPFDPAMIEVPVEFWYGGQDTSPVHSPDFGESLAARIPHARRHLLAEAGGALLWTHAERILTSLLRLTGALPPADQ